MSATGDSQADQYVGAEIGITQVSLVRYLISVHLWLVRASGPLAILITSAVPPVSTAQEHNNPVYVVQQGDSLYSIAQAFRSSVEELQAVNDIKDPTLIDVGQTVVIPGFEGIPGELAIRTLVNGDTLYSLTRALDADRTTLVRLNRIVSPATLYLGQPIIYPVTEIQGGDDADDEGERLVIATRYDTLTSLAAGADEQIAALGIRNALSSAGDIYPGRRIFMPAPNPVTGFHGPIIAMQVVPDHPAQGEPLVVTVQLQGDAVLSGTLGEETLQFVGTSYGSFALHGVRAMADPGTYPLVIHAQLPAGGGSAFETMVPISDAQYQYQAIVLPQEKSGLLSDSAGVEAEAARIESLASFFSHERLWDTQFSPPLASDYITSTFGLRRSYNGGPYETFHSGLDFGAPTDTPIRASAAGMVVLAETLRIRGNATVIDHGWGVFTTYWHQSRLLVSAGQRVSAGETIGHVGDSGLSTGTHLHWEVWVGGNQINPTAWLNSEIPQTLRR